MSCRQEVGGAALDYWERESYIMALPTETATYQVDEAALARVAGIDGDTLTLQLLQEPYDIARLHEGDVGEYPLEALTDWQIHGADRNIVPITSYLLDM